MSTLTLHYTSGATQILNLHDSFFTKLNKHGEVIKRHPAEIHADAAQLCKDIAGNKLLKFGIAFEVKEKKVDSEVV